MVAVSLRGVVKRFGDHQVVHGIDLEIAANEFVVLVGPSGCGKSTILRMIAGLEEISGGEIATDGRVVNELAPKDRDIAMVFQDYALYPHLTVQRNMSFGLEMQKLPKAEIRQRVEAAADILNIRNLLDRKPKALSGGQRQRVAMGRAIVRRPKVFLFDEPLSNLDAKLRTQMRTEIKKLHRALATTIIYVTHDQVEAMTLADRVVVLRDGHIEQIGTPDEIYNAPRSLFVAGFVGAPTMNFIPARLEDGDGGAALRLEDGTALALDGAQRDRYAAHLGRDVILGLRPEFFSVAEPARATLTPRVNVVEPMGSDTLFYFQIGAAELVARTPPLSGVHPGDPLPLHVDLRRLHLFDPATEEVL
ncbi:MAG: sn-glycerol-3-phosphate ABC transporter ATP-binding protein UgpC [Hyphomicrobiales bacterium]|nr:sn-glycerol-3-phosphate ABC transporter ATP-binding protein UgpC [Hyphomicrobiales bacterium]